MLHDFRQSLSKSLAAADDPIWERIYRLAFHNFASMVCVRDDGWAQRGGIDRVVVLGSGKTILVDEKVRPTKDYGDILLEYWSAEEHKTVGWVAKDLACDYIAYAVIPAQKCYLIPFQQLRNAWKRNGRAWVSKYPRIEAKNKSYTTVSVGVPVDVLFDAIRNSMVVEYQLQEAA